MLYWQFHFLSFLPKNVFHEMPKGKKKLKFFCKLVPITAAPLECDITQYNTHSIVGLPSANDEGWFTVRCPQARTGQIRCVNSTWQKPVMLAWISLPAASMNHLQDFKHHQVYSTHTDV